MDKDLVEFLNSDRQGSSEPSPEVWRGLPLGTLIRLSEQPMAKRPCEAIWDELRRRVEDMPFPGDGPLRRWQSEALAGRRRPLIKIGSPTKGARDLRIAIVATELWRRHRYSKTRIQREIADETKRRRENRGIEALEPGTVRKVLDKSDYLPWQQAMSEIELAGSSMDWLPMTATKAAQSSGKPHRIPRAARRVKNYF